ncbi:hypothetical protein [Streptomyces xinghaiensis]|uniref:hypothetical protein n=1 Tax=Streptomyces xinghaiensis TaxID=1038928 RepID=UPI00030594C5|nr:hypothetical protein [Streptomyces xinghaiensis]
MALVVVVGVVWLAAGGDDDGSGDTVAAQTPSASAGETDAGADPTQAGPEPTPPPTPSETEPEPDSTGNPFVPKPTGTGLQAVWKASDGPMLALGDAYTNEPRRINAIYDDRDGLECKGRWQKAGAGDELVVVMLCEQDGERVKSKDRHGRLSQSGDTLTVKWDQGANGTDTFERFRDMEED